ncbi:nucleotidyltransferase family protein [Niallia oryzisoli]|uniref:Nucleotidyltransferase family protein n=1 Tax=Niallia oryzisoli TaxID=1737571 RepID=A0ABZ2CK11_9BACI
MLEHTISKFEAVCSRVIVEAGFQAEMIQEEIAKISSKNVYSFRIKFVYNETFNQGMFRSIQRGCNEVQAQSFFITPGDCPLVRKDTIQLLAEQKRDVVIPSFNYKGGAPNQINKQSETENP